jgi:UDP-glucose:(heptosyl)LPS alpha-1,3-glucosyltransferase
MTSSTPKKIAVVVQKYGLIGGAERLVLEVTERIALNPYCDVHVLANQWARQSDRVTFHKIPIIAFPRFMKPISFARFVEQKISAMDFDLVHSHERVFHADVFSIHGLPHQTWVKQVRKKRMSLFDRATAWIERSLIRNGGCRAFLAVSSLTKAKYLEEFGLEVDKVQVIHPGVSIEKFANESRDVRELVRRLYGISASDTVVLFVGMNFEIKGLDILISAVSLAKSRNPSESIKLLVVGKGNFRKYGALCRRLGLKDDVIFAGVLKDHVENVYIAADVFSMLSKFDAFGLTVLEAMAASLPVIISTDVGAADLVEEGVNGFKLGGEDIPAIASKIALLLNPQTRSSLSLAARQTAGQHTWEEMAQKTIGVYETLLSG